MININNYIVGAYIRLSKEDINKSNKSESESVINQRKLIQEHLHNNNLKIDYEYVDDGYSGTNFDRPGFQKMLEDINSKKINMIITKDLSRIGRDYIKCGYYLEEYFPLKGIRYISILDNIDTLIDNYNNELVPFKAVFNDLQSKDTSKKIKSILRNKKEQGLFLGNSASFGYRKDPLNKYRLVIDNVASNIVKYIFFLSLIGKSNKEICSYLNSHNVPTPSTYKDNKLYNEKKWNSSSIHNILSNYMYTGNLVQGTKRKLNYKSKKRINVSKDNWIIVPNTHEPIISENVYNIVNNKAISNKDSLLLYGLAFCNDCKSIMSIKKDKRSKNIRYYLNCNRYCRNTKKKLCSSHFISYSFLENYVLNELEKKSIHLYNKEDVNKFIKNIEIAKNKKIIINYCNI